MDFLNSVVCSINLPWIISTITFRTLNEELVEADSCSFTKTLYPY